MLDPDKSVLQTVDDVIDAAGGTVAVAKRFGYPATGQAVSQWRKRGVFPAETYATWQEILSELKKSAPRSLWRQREAAQ